MIADPSDSSFKDILIIWGIVAPIVTGIAGYFGKRWHIRYHIQQEKLNTARTDFINAFTPTIVKIQNIDDVISFPFKELESIFIQHRVMHQETIAKFRGLLSSKKAVAFDQAWIDFSCEDYRKRKLPKYYNYLDTNSAPEIKKTALNNIYVLLKFANYKS